MNLDLKKLVREALRAAFALKDCVVQARFCRPAGLNSFTGQVAPEPVELDCTLLPLEGRLFELGGAPPQPGDQRILVRATDLASVPRPGPGDYLLEIVSSTRRDIFGATLDRFGEAWTFHTRLSPHEDRGGLGTAAVFEDYGDLATATEHEDWLSLA